MRIETYFKNEREIQEDCKAWAEEISKTFIPDLVIFVAKSGFLFAEQLASSFGCPMASVIASRPDNGKKDLVHMLLPKMPKSIIMALLKYKVSRKNYDEKTKRIVKSTSSLDNVDLSSKKGILIVDDSVDTGWSLVQVLEMLSQKGMKDNYKVASYSVLSPSMKRIRVDYYRYLDTIVMTSTSRYSKEHDDFLYRYNEWNKQNE